MKAIKTKWHIALGIFFALLLMLTFFSCKEKLPPLLAEKIEYDVIVKNNEGNTDWWVQNLEGPQREKIVNALFDAAKSGQYKVYDYGNNLLEGKDLDLLFKHIETYTVPSLSDPETDSIVSSESEIDKRDINRIIFLEKWYFDEKNLNLTKKVIGYGPVLTKYIYDSETEERILKGYMPLFWIYLDDDYPDKLKN